MTLLILNQLTKQKKKFTKISPHNSEKDDCEVDASAVLKKVRLKNVNTVLIGYINGTKHSRMDQVKFVEDSL